MKNIGFMGTNLNAAAHKALNAPTAKERKFRTALINNDEARAVVDQVDLVGRQMRELDQTSHDLLQFNDAVRVEATPSKVRRGLTSIFNGPLATIAALAPEGGSETPEVRGVMNSTDLDVVVEYAPGKMHRVSSYGTDDGSKVYKVNDKTVEMTPSGAILMV